MPGMGTGLNENDPTIVSAFHSALLRQLLVVLLILAFVAVAWGLLRSVQLRCAAGRAVRALGPAKRGRPTESHPDGACSGSPSGSSGSSTASCRPRPRCRWGWPLR